ncbi:MAG: tetratricopeptide repeat protein [Spirochaetota bacterium]
MSSLELYIAVFIGVVAAFSLLLLARRFVSPRKIQAIEHLIELGNVRSALRQVRAMLRWDQKNIDAHWLLGECYRAQGQSELAVNEYKYITTKGKYTAFVSERKVRLRLAEEYMKLKQLDECQKEYILLTRLEPNNYEYYYRIGRLFEERNLHDPALVNYRKVLSLNPAHSETHMRIGVILYNKKDYIGAQKSFDKAIQFSANMKASYYYLGRIAMVSGDLGKALDLFEKSLQDQEFGQKAFLERANIFAMKREFFQAIQELEKALRMGDENLQVVLEIRYLLALCFEESKDIGKAIEQWEWINERSPGYRDVPSKLAHYADLRIDDRLKDFFILPQEKFTRYCEDIVHLLGLEVQEINLKNQETAEILAYESRGRGREEISLMQVIRIFRTSEPVGVEALRELYDQMKRINALRGICVTASKFSRSAIDFAQTRPIELVDKDELSRFLHQMDRQ